MSSKEEKALADFMRVAAKHSIAFMATLCCHGELANGRRFEVLVSPKGNTIVRYRGRMASIDLNPFVGAGAVAIDRAIAKDAALTRKMGRREVVRKKKQRKR